MLTAIAIKRFVETGDTPDVSEALQRLLGDVLAPRLPTHVLESRNHARRLACYKEAVVDALLPQLHTMHTVFAFYCTLRKDDSRKEQGMMSPSELLALCEDLLATSTSRSATSNASFSRRACGSSTPYTASAAHDFAISTLKTSWKALCVSRSSRPFRPPPTSRRWAWSPRWSGTSTY